MRRSPAAAAAFLLLFLASGCENRLWWDYSDDIYIANMAKQGEQEALRNVNSINKEDRQMALRILASMVGDNRAKGYRDDAERLEKIIIRRYFVDKDPEVRACIVRVCAPSAGRGSTEMVEFLRERIAAGEFPGYAALSLASLVPRDAFADIEPLTRHPAHEVRYQAAVALTVLGDPRGFEPVMRVVRNMQPGTWPDRVEGAPLAEAQKNLGLRAARAFGRPVNQ